MKIAIFPGSFDPMHAGHVNIIDKASKLFDHIYVVVSKNWGKDNQSPIDQRIAQVKTILQGRPQITVIANSSDFTYNIAQKYNAQFIIRGLRNDNDFTYELELNYANKKFSPDLETIYFVADYGLNQISSTIERQIKMINQEKTK